MVLAYQMNKQAVLEDWEEVKGLLKRDTDKIPFIDERLHFAFSAFDEGKKEIGKAAMFEVYNLQLRKLR